MPRIVWMGSWKESRIEHCNSLRNMKWKVEKAIIYIYICWTYSWCERLLNSLELGDVVSNNPVEAARTICGQPFSWYIVICYYDYFSSAAIERERDFSSAGCKESLTWKLRLKLSIHIYLWCLISSGSIAMILFNVYPFLLSVFSLFGKDPERLEKDSWEEHMTCCGSYMSVFILWISVVTFLVFRCFNIRVENVYMGNIFRCFGDLWGNLLGVLHRFCQFQVWCFQIVSFWAAAHTTIVCLVLVCKSIHVSSILYSALSYMQCCNDDFLQSGAPKHSQTVSNIL